MPETNDPQAHDAHKTGAPKPGCIMCDSLYVKPDGGLPCWDDVGEDLILRTLDEQKLIAGTEEPVFYTPELKHIRSSFRAGELPYPDFCTRCPLNGHGLATSLEPRIMNVLHVEPAWLCQLACPQCFTPKERLGLKKPPYYMSVDFYRGLMEQLKNEGVEHIRFVHFEGRGDPLLNKELHTMVELTKEFFPDSFVMATTHGNYPFKPWMHECGLDVLRLSVDGAFEENYQRYRVGGKLSKVIQLMTDIKNARPDFPDSNLRLEWKYILFEWNDSDEEIREAGRIADEMDLRLRFCLTHTPGRSQRFTNAQELHEALEELAPGTSYETTFQLRDEPSDADSTDVLGEHAEALLTAAITRLRRNDEPGARQLIAEALTFDPGFDAEQLPADSHPLRDRLDDILSRSRFPSTLSTLANLACRLEEWHAAEGLFQKYLEKAPDAWDRPKVESILLDLKVGNRLGRHLDEANRSLAHQRLKAERAALEFDSDVPERCLSAKDPIRLYRDEIAENARPKTLFLLARLRRAGGDAEAADHLLQACLKRADSGIRQNAELQQADWQTSSTFGPSGWRKIDRWLHDRWLRL